MRRNEVLFAVIGGVVGAVLTMSAGSIAPLGAQNEVKDAEFGTISCSSILLKDLDGTIYGGMYILNNRGLLYMDRKGNSGRVSVSVDEHGGYVQVRDKDNKMAGISSDETGGLVEVFDKNGERKAHMKADGDGGEVAVYGESGAGAIMRVKEHGGAFSMYGKGNDQVRAMLSVNEYGNGALSTWDKNGYRLATLK